MGGDAAEGLGEQLDPLEVRFLGDPEVDEHLQAMLTPRWWWWFWKTPGT